jgi:hypothetical protein
MTTPSARPAADVAAELLQFHARDHGAFQVRVLVCELGAFAHSGEALAAYDLLCSSYTSGRPVSRRVRTERMEALRDAIAAQSGPVELREPIW